MFKFKNVCFAALANNKLSAVEANTFNGLTALPVLYLQGNVIGSISPRAFSNMTVLREVSKSNIWGASRYVIALS